MPHNLSHPLFPNVRWTLAQPVANLGPRQTFARHTVHALSGQSSYGPSLIVTMCGQTMPLANAHHDKRDGMWNKEARFADPDTVAVTCKSCRAAMIRESVPARLLANQGLNRTSVTS